MTYSRQDVLVYPGGPLLRSCSEVIDFDGELKDFVDHMYSKMYEYSGIGLAANQVGENKQIIVIDIPLSPTEVFKEVLINPKTVMHVKNYISVEEGCLSFPDVRIKTRRYMEVLVEYQDLVGKKITKTFKGFPSICVQHEMDHLKGKTFLDFTSEIKRKIITDRLKNDYQ